MAFQKMNYLCHKCAIGILSKCEDNLTCVNCKINVPILDGIPIFASSPESDTWSAYAKEGRIDVAGGSYANSEPSPPVLFYSQFIPSEARNVLDVGGGDGNTIADWATHHPEAEVWVVDLSLFSLGKALRRGIKNLKVLCSAANSRLPFQNGCIDAISSVFLIEHMETGHQRQFLQEARRLLKNDGVLVVATDTAFYDKFTHPVERWIKTRRWIKNDRTHINLMWLVQCRKLLIEEGFRIFEERNHYIAGRHKWMQLILKLLPKSFSDRFLSTMFIIKSIK